MFQCFLDFENIWPADVQLPGVLNHTQHTPYRSMNAVYCIPYPYVYNFIVFVNMAS